MRNQPAPPDGSQRDDYPPAVVDNSVYPGNGKHKITPIPETDNSQSGTELGAQLTPNNGPGQPLVPLVKDGDTVITVPVFPRP
jgi:hypothetical protein